MVTSELPGERLSVIVGENIDLASMSYMEEYGQMLERIHRLKPKTAPVADRRFFHPPTEDLLAQLDLDFLKPYFAHEPGTEETVFCHGDFHYANVLWQDHHISGILDFELCGYGNRNFDIA